MKIICLNKQRIINSVPELLHHMNVVGVADDSEVHTASKMPAASPTSTQRNNPRIELT
jgi:hypothetical protein